MYSSIITNSLAAALISSGGTGMLRRSPAVGPAFVGAQGGHRTDTYFFRRRSWTGRDRNCREDKELQDQLQGKVVVVTDVFLLSLL